MVKNKQLLIRHDTFCTYYIISKHSVLEQNDTTKTTKITPDQKHHEN